MSIIPAKFLKVTIENLYDNDFWSDGVNPGPWDGVTYRWYIEGQIETQTHSSPNTPDPYQYSGYDIKIGDWFSDDTGRAYKIIAKPQDGANVIAFIVEDVDQVNTYNDPQSSGFGGPQSYSGFIFSLNEDGTPNLSGLQLFRYPVGLFDALQSRFTSRNATSDFISFYEENGAYAIGDFIMIDENSDGGFKLCSANDVNVAIGIISEINVPKTYQFSYKSLNPIEDNIQPPLEGEYGDIFYMDPANPGKVTGIKPLTKPKPVYIRLDSPNRAVRLNAIVDDSGDIQKTHLVIPTANQTQFTLPADTNDVLIMSINGIETKNFTFDKTSKVLTFDPNATGYGVDNQDEVLFIYQA